MAGTGRVLTFDPNVHNMLEVRRDFQAIREQIPISSYDWSGSIDFDSDMPGITDDITKGWKIGSIIIFDTVIFWCTSNAVDAAVWQQLGTSHDKTGGTIASADIVKAEDYAILWDFSASLNKRATVEDFVFAGGTHAMLDGAFHTDSVADAVTRGSLIYGNATPNWDELVVGSANQFVGTDGTSVAWATPDHGSIDGLGDDDHTFYSRADGTRAFTGTVVGVFPTSSSHLATKEYVDQAISFENTFLFNNTASDIGGIYYVMSETATGEAESSFTTAGLGAGDDQALVNFATLSGVPGVATLKHGVYSGHIHVEKTAGTRSVNVYFAIYTRVTGGAETLRTTSEISDPITSKADVDLHANLADDVDINDTDRIIIKWFANIGAAGSAATVVLYAEGANNSNLNIPTSVEVLSSVFLRQDGTKELSADWDAGAFGIRALTFESDVMTGTAPLVVASTTVCANLNADLLDGKEAAVFATLSGTETLTNKTFGDDVRFNAEILDDAGTAVLENEQIGVVTKVLHVPDPVATDEFAFDMTDRKITVLQVWGETDTGTVTFNIEMRAMGSGEAAGTDILSDDLVADDDSANTTTFDSSGVVDGSSIPQWLVLVITSVASSPTDLKVCIKYKRYGA